MKKLIILLVAAYVGILAFEYYQKAQTIRIWNDERWQYCLKVLYNNDFKEPSDTYLPRWQDNFRVEISGNPTEEDRKTLEKSIAQFRELIAPKKIIISNKAPNIKICFLPGRSIFPYQKPTKETFSNILFSNTMVTKTSIKDIVTNYSPHFAYLNIRSDSTTQIQRNGFIIKELTYVLLCFTNQPKPNCVSYLDKEGHILSRRIDNPHFSTSIFNTNCSNCNELTDIDKYFLKTYYSQKLEKTIAAHSPYNYIKRSSKFIYIETTIVIAILLTLYFFGYFRRTIFSFFDNHIRAKWLAFNCKVLFVVLLFSILYVTTDLLTYYGFASGVVSKLISFDFPWLLFFWFLHLKFWIAYVLIPVNGIYLIEKVLFPRFEQFAKQQLFSFILLVAGILFTMYLLRLKGGQFPFNLGNYWISLCIGVGIGVIRFLYNYSNYQKKLAFIEKEKELTQLRELKTRAELNALQSKINPHFLYNALNSIAGLAHENADKVEQMALALSKLFRYSINKEDDDFTTVQNEIEMVSIYLDIEKVRFGEKLQYQVIMPKELENERIPKFIIQPLVENAIKHGISKITSLGVLKLVITKNDNSLKIMVSDNGPDFPEDLMTGYGLQNIYEKLDILYPGKYEVILQNSSNKNISVILKN